MTKEINNKKVVDNKNNNSIDNENDQLTETQKKLMAKYPSRTLEELRKRDYVHQYQDRLPKIEREGYVVSWICDTPFKGYINYAYESGYDFIPGVEPVESGYSGPQGEYLHYAMQIPVEIYKENEKAKLALTKKMYGHILEPDDKGKGRDIVGDGMYIPKGRSISTVSQVLSPNK